MMERSSKYRSRRDRKTKKPPKVPIKTYRWEDVRRSRRRGGYPWTHLYKGPYKEKVDPEQFTMDAFRRSKSSSPMGRRSDQIEISEVSSWADYSGKTTPTLLQQLINEPGDVSEKNSRPSSVVIEEYTEEDDKYLEDDVQIKEFQTESAESSDNISQYLDKEELPASSKAKETLKDSKDSINSRGKRARSEETGPRKRKLSAESSHSRYSLSKLGMIKKLQKAKSKIKVPKIIFPTKKSARKKSPSKEGKPKLKETKKTVTSSQPKKEEKPVYIYIPLRPPPDETEELPNLEFETKKEETIPKINHAEQKTDETNETKADTAKKSPFSSLERGPRVTKRPPLKIKPEFKQLLKDVRQLKEKEDAVEGAIKLETDEQLLPKEDVFDQLFEASASKSQEEELRQTRSKSAEPQQNKRRSSMDSSYSRKSLSKLGLMKKLKDVSGKIKSPFSLDNLRKKPSKKEDQVKREDDEEKAKKTKSTGTKAGQLLAKPKNVEPVYIHIPLKPPEGVTDEFSYLADEPVGGAGATSVSVAETKKDERTDSLDSTSPLSDKNGAIQFIFLTPPSDDEILDEKEPDIPETPSSSDDMVFFSSLKKLAQDAVDLVSPENKKVTLETVREESVSDKGSTVSEVQEVDTKEEKMIVDVEDGLNEVPKVEENLKSALKSTETGAIKRVSFKRKSKTPKQSDTGDKDNGYETIEPPKEAIDLNQEKDSPAVEEQRKLEDDKNIEAKKADVQKLLTQSMSADEEITYLDNKIVKDTSLEDDYNKWSNLAGDHEYEPISPPEEMTMMTSGILTEVTVLNDDSGDPKVVISATEILDKPLEEKRKLSFFQFGRFHKEKDVPNENDKSQERDTPSISSEGKDLPASEDRSGPNKFQAAIKHRTEQLKTKTNELCTKLHNIKKPNIHFPKTAEFKKPQFKKPQFKKPDLKRFKIEKPKINLHLPKIPDTATIRFPNISIPGARKTSETRTVETRRISIEPASDEPKRHRFEFNFGGTFPRFRKAKKEPEVAFATVPRSQKTPPTMSSDSTSSARVPLHSEGSMEDFDNRQVFSHGEEAWISRKGAALENVQLHRRDIRTGYEDREKSSFDIGQEEPPRSRFVEDEYERENQEINRANYLSRWQHGNFRERNEDDDNKDERIVGELVEQRFGRYGRYEDETLEDRLRRDEDRPLYIEEEEFELRLNKQMVTDLDNLEDDQAGQFKDGYSSEGSVSLHRRGRLGKLDIDSDEFFVVHEIREGFQTPANALAQMNEYDPIGSNRSLPTQIREEPPTKAERKSIKKPKRKKTPHVSQEEIPGDEESLEEPSRPRRTSKRNKKKVEPSGAEFVVPYQESIPVDANVPHGQRLDFPRESLGILADDERDDHDEHIPSFQAVPDAPPRKHRSLKSLTQSENESILAEQELIDNHLFTNILQTQQKPPQRPGRRSRSHTSSLSRVGDTDSLFTDEGYSVETEQIPSYLIENRNFKTEDEPLRPCVEEPCVQDLRDYMGYSIVDKSKPPRDPLPPKPKTPPRRKKRATADDKFATVPRNMGLNQQGPPVRPLRNYSTLSHIKSSRKPEQQKNKENEIVDIRQYIEVEDDVNRDLVSGEVVQKMRQRPLPAPPRPPRKLKNIRKSLQDITSQENILPTTSDQKQGYTEEETVSTQTEPLPPDFVCEEIVREPTDTIITARAARQPEPIKEEAVPKSIIVERNPIYDPRVVKKELITPSIYSFEETVTHGTLLVQPIGDSKVVPDNQLSRERLIPVTKESSDEDVSEVPESFKYLKSPEKEKVDKLHVGELQASKLVVSEIDTTTISANEIQGKSGGVLKLSDVELPPHLLEQILTAIEDSNQKKTPNVELGDSLLQQERESYLEHDVNLVTPPLPPPRGCTLAPHCSPPKQELLEPEVDDEEPPPRPPQPLEGMYLPSQPPASFYALRAKQLVDDENIPTAPRRKRHHSTKSRPISRSRSTSDDSSLVDAPLRPTRNQRRASEPSIPELSLRLGQACLVRLSSCLKRLIYHVSENLLRNADGQQDAHVMLAILLVLVAGLLLLGGDGERTIVHLHHWEYFNPPKDL